MKYVFWICCLFVILSGLSLNFYQSVFAQESFSNSSTAPKTDPKENISSNFMNVSYSFEPFLILDGKHFEDISHNDTLSLETFAISAWIRTNLSNIENQAQLVNKGGFNIDEKGKNMNYGIWISSDGTISGGFETKSGKDFIVASSERYDDGKWHYVLFSYDGHVLRLDIDGKTKIATTKQSDNVIPDTKGKQPIRIGANSGDKSKFFTGDIDEIRIWNRGLTPAEISQIYSNNTFNSDGLVAYLNFDKNGLYTRTNNASLIFDKPKSSGILTTTGAKKQSITNKTNEKSESFNSSPYLFNIGNTDSPNFFKSIPSTSNNQSSTIEQNSSFNIAIAADWGCEEDTKKTATKIKKIDPEIVIAAGDLSYDKSADCWFDIIKPFKSKMKIAFGDHEYNDTNHGKKGLINQYLEPFNLTKTYYSFDKDNVHFTVIDPQIDYDSNSDQYRFIDQDLKNASTNPNIDWIFVVESRPLYTSPSYHPSDPVIRDLFHPLFDHYGVDLVFSSENHNYQRTFPLKYNIWTDSSNPIITDRNQNMYTGDYEGAIYFTVGIGGKSLYKIKEQESFVAKQDDQHFGFLNIEITGKTLNGTLYANENKLSKSNYVDYKNRILDQFTISKMDN